MPNDQSSAPQPSPCPKTGFYCRCPECEESRIFCAKLMRDIENNVPFGKGESGC